MRKTDKRRPNPKKALLTLLLAAASLLSVAQNVGEYYHDVTDKEWNFQIFANTAGFGGGFQHGRTPDLYNKHFWEIQFMLNKHPKSIRSINAFYDNVRPIRYGQLYTLFFLQAGYGYQRTLHLKPYWGGVQVSYNLSVGPALGIGIPNYVEVLNYNTGFSEIVRYDPEKHNLNNILGGARLYHGISQTIFRPGFYAKTGLVFDLAKNDYKLTALEIGLQIQMIFPFVQQMAFNPAKKFYLTGYLSFNFGKKIGRQR
ncbi:MAG: hypothetical protein IJK22_11070 [Bacteroidales bacterium]|nr:hypothetical protein [Bacteroidales bacterium]